MDAMVWLFRKKVTEPHEFTVDSGGFYSVAATPVLQRLGIRSLKQETFRLANGTIIIRYMGVAVFKFQEWIGGADVIFGEEGDATCLAR